MFAQVLCLAENHGNHKDWDLYILTAFHGDKAKKNKTRICGFKSMYVLSFINLPIFNLGTNALLHPGPIILLSKYNTHNLHHVENSATVDLNTFLYIKLIKITTVSGFILKRLKKSPDG